MVETAKDLGLAIDTSLKPSLQCREGFSRARAVFFMMRRGFAELTSAKFRPPYLAMVRLQLEYAVQAVTPYLQKDLKLVESMQRLATRCVKGIRGLQYPARLRELQLPFMQSHILRTTLITAYNLFHSNLILPLEEFFDAPAMNHLRRHQFKVQQPRSQLGSITGTYKHFDKSMVVIVL